MTDSGEQSEKSPNRSSWFFATVFVRCMLCQSRHEQTDRLLALPQPQKGTRVCFILLPPVRAREMVASSVPRRVGKGGREESCRHGWCVQGSSQSQSNSGAHLLAVLYRSVMQDSSSLLVLTEP